MLFLVSLVEHTSRQSCTGLSLVLTICAPTMFTQGTNVFWGPPGNKKGHHFVSEC